MAIALVYLVAVLKFGLKGFERGLFASYLPPTLGIILLTFPFATLILHLKPGFAINVAYNKVRIPEIFTFFMEIGNFLLAVIPYLTGWNYYGVALAGAIMLTLKNEFFIPWYATKVLEISRTTFVKSMLPEIFSMAVTAVTSYLVASYFLISGLISLLICGIVLTAFYLLFVWGFGLDPLERQTVESLIPVIIRRSRLNLEAKCDR